MFDILCPYILTGLVLRPFTHLLVHKHAQRREAEMEEGREGERGEDPSQSLQTAPHTTFLFEKCHLLDLPNPLCLRKPLTVGSAIQVRALTACIISMVCLKSCLTSKIAEVGGTSL